MNRPLWFGALALALTGLPAARAADEPQIVPDVVYGHKDGMALTFDVIKPARPNGAGLLSIQSGGWYSGWVEPKVVLGIVRPYLEKGYTVFIVRHGSAPKYTVPEAVADVRRSVRSGPNVRFPRSGLAATGLCADWWRPRRAPGPLGSSRTVPRR